MTVVVAVALILVVVALEVVGAAPPVEKFGIKVTIFEQQQEKKIFQHF